MSHERRSFAVLALGGRPASPAGTTRPIPSAVPARAWRASLASALLAWTVLPALALVTTGCESLPDCSSGGMRYEGRPPRQLFAYDSTCRSDCFSMPASGCDIDCPSVFLPTPAGVLWDDRSLVLADLASLGSDRALVFSFGYVDEAGGEAPAGWGLIASGPRTYLSDQVEGTARFDIGVGVAEVEVDLGSDTDLLALAGAVGELWPAVPGRVEILSTSTQHIGGRFFLGFETTTGQPQGEVIGCFEVSLSEPRLVGEDTYQVVVP